MCLYNQNAPQTNGKFQNVVSGDDIYTLDIWGTFFITNLVFWSIGSIYCYFDVTTTPKFLRKYKIQPDTNEPVDPKKFKNLIWTVLFNQTVVYIPILLLGHRALVWRGRPDVKILPDFQTVILEFFFCAIVEEVIFYYSHILLHHKRIYKVYDEEILFNTFKKNSKYSNLQGYQHCKNI